MEDGVGINKAKQGEEKNKNNRDNIKKMVESEETNHERLGLRFSFNIFQTNPISSIWTFK